MDPTDPAGADLRYLQGMNRVRHAFHEMRPELAACFITGHHDDMRGIFGTYGPVVDAITRGRASILHGLTTMPAMVSVVCACLAGTIAGALLLLVTRSPAVAGIGTVAVLLLVVAGSFRLMAHSIASTAATLDVAFPSEPRRERTGVSPARPSPPRARRSARRPPPA